MKQIFKSLMVVAMSAFTIVSCSKDDTESYLPEEENNDFVSISILSGDETRTHLDQTDPTHPTIKWDADDQLAVIEQAGETITKQTTTTPTLTQEGTIAEFTVKFAKSDATSFQYYAISNSNLKTDPTQLNTVEIEHPAEQHPSTTSYDPNANILVSGGNNTTLESQPTSLKFRFYRPVTIVKMNIKGLTEGETIQSVTFGNTTQNLTGTLMWDFVKDDISGIKAETGAKQLTMLYDEAFQSNATDGNTVYFTTLPCELTDFKVVVTTNAARYTKEVICDSKPLTFRAGRMASFSVGMTDRIEEPAFISIANLDTFTDNQITIQGKDLQTGDVLNIASLAGEVFTAENITLENVQNTTATFTLPAGASKDRSYRVDLVRNGAVKASTAVRPDNDFVTLPYGLALFLTGAQDTTIPNDGTITNVKRSGYIDGKILEFNAQTKEAKLWRKDAKLTPITFADKCFHMENAQGFTSIEVLKNTFDFSGVTETVMTAGSSLEELDLSMFPEASSLHGDNGNLKTLTFGKKDTSVEVSSKIVFVTVNNNQLTSINFENAGWLMNLYAMNNHLSGTLTINDEILPWLITINVSNNQYSAVDFGIATEFANWNPEKTQGTIIASDKHIVTCNRLQHFIAENNQLSKIDIDNCGQLIACRIAGNPIQEAKLSNNAPTGGQTYLTVYKSPECFSINFEQDAICYVDYYWWNILSDGNKGAVNNYKGYNIDGNKFIKCTLWEDWATNNPLVNGHKAGTIKLYEMGEFAYNNSENYVKLVK